MSSVFINVLPGTMRIALCHDGRLQDLMWENLRTRHPQNAIYLGRVNKVLSGIQSAFVDLGGGETAFLNRSGLPPSMKTTAKTNLADVLKPGQSLWVQIRKPALEGKQCQVSACPRYLGFFLIFLPMESGVRFSRKFTADRKAYSNLKVLAEGGGGWIVRSSASGATPEMVAGEAMVLRKMAEEVMDPPEGKCRMVRKPDPIQEFLLNRSAALPKGIYIDDRDSYEALRGWLQTRYSKLVPAVHHHDSARPIYEVYKVQSQIEKALGQKVWLPSGGAIEVRQTPALVAIDVNSGKNVKSRAGKSSGLRTNLEALDEVANQIRLRNLAGLIVVDFIDMKQGKEAKQLAEAAKGAFLDDDVNLEQLPINRFGLLILTRERNGPDLNRQTHRPCPRCKGKGWVLKGSCLAVDVQSALMRDGEGYRDEVVRVRCHTEFAGYLEANKLMLFSAIEKMFGFQVTIAADPDCGIESFSFELVEDCP